MRHEQGSALIVAVIAMLIMGVLSLSFALLSGIEARIGLNGKQQGQAEALAEAGLDRARDALRNAAREPCGFTRWTATAAVAGCGTPIGPLLFSNQTPAAFSAEATTHWYSARADNDCSTPQPLVPAGIQQAGCPMAVDTNQTAVVTVWARAGTGRARVRALIAIDSGWKHVCASPKAASYCDDASAGNGPPHLQPADPNDPNGPQAFDDLPRPILGCSRIDPTLHRRASDPTGITQAAQCSANPRMFSYPYPDHLTPGTTPRFVMMGADPAVTAGAKACSGGGQTYFGYFDCALQTPCPVAVCGGAAGRPACVRPADTRLVSFPREYAPPPCVPGVNTGMVFVGDQTLPNIGTGFGDERTIYVLNGRVGVQGKTIYGTLMVEGGDGAGGCSSKDLQVNSGAVVWAGPSNGLGSGAQYGYPLALGFYNPDMAPPTSSAPQGTCADMGSGGGTALHGLVYSGGRVEFDQFQVDGSIVAFESRAQGGATSEFVYNYKYGNDAPPPGFPEGEGTQVRILRKSFIACMSYSDDSGGGTACP